MAKFDLGSRSAIEPRANDKPKRKRSKLWIAPVFGLLFLAGFWAIKSNEESDEEYDEEDWEVHAHGRELWRSQ